MTAADTTTKRTQIEDNDERDVMWKTRERKLPIRNQGVQIKDDVTPFLCVGIDDVSERTRDARVRLHVK